ncbi:MAG TPA: PDZ domain-containing protein [Bacteroidales bacterium]|nr:PDZ domain-containing protein [Bacteroidales bacterium]HNS47431.1 PDZ domain-containing protein [Bacteroidales bacterium]
MKTQILLLPFCFLLFTFCSLTSTAQAPLMRFPDIHQDQIVFVSGEDIWSVPATGGIAQRLTFHNGEERFPKFSPDGSLITFTGYYDGNPDVYVMNPYGGEITRVTWHPGFDEVVGWHPTKNKIIYKAANGDYPGYTKLFLVSPDGTGTEELILHESGNGCFSSDGSKIVYTKVSTENRTWKRYRGGLAPDLYIYDFKTNEDRNITNFEGTDGLPMWIGEKIFFNSDRSRASNIWSVDPRTLEMKQLTFHTDYEVRRPSEGGNKIVYELGGKLMVLDLTTEKTNEVPVRILADLPEVRPYLKDVRDFITDVALSPKGERALIVARGEIFTLPVKEGAIRNLTQSSGARDKDAVWSPDGSQIAYISDKTGEYEIYVSDPKGENEAIRLTTSKNGYRHTLKWSPDSKKIAYTDQTLTLYILDVSSKQITTVDKADYENIDVSIDMKPIYDFSWSPDSRYIAYTKRDADLVNKIHIYTLETNEIHCLSTMYNDFHPVFSPCGKHLFFISNRRFDPTYCDFEWQMVYKRVAGIYCLTLAKDGTPLFPFESDEALSGKTEAAKKDEATSDNRVVIDFEGLYDRIEALPVPAGNYRRLSVTDEGLLYLNSDKGDFNEFEFRVPETMDLYRFGFADKAETSVIKEINRYELSADGKKIVYQQGDKVGILPAGASDSKGQPLALGDLKMWLDPGSEWKQIFNEAWRYERDYYYEPNMHGIDWDLMKERYGKMMEKATCRQDVVFIIGELISELNTSHTYVYGGDVQRKADRVSVGLLGADYEADATAGRYRFKRILRDANWSSEAFPPLARPEINVKEGDYLLSVNGTDVLTSKNIYSYFQNLANKQVTITVNDRPVMEGARTYVVKPVASENNLRYMAWVENNRRIVNEVSGGQIGYMHFPDTYTGTAVQFPAYFYSQTQKKGLIIDGRFNGGGLDPDIFLKRLRAPHSYWTRRYSSDQTSPAYSTTAHMVCLTNRQAGSGGDELPFEFRQFGMGPVIGTRTWGGLVGVSMFIPLIDGGGMTAPDYRIYSPEGKWVVENVGVTPDIIIDLHPAEVAKGYDAQLMKGVEVLLKKTKDDPRPWPGHEAFPVDR